MGGPSTFEAVLSSLLSPSPTTIALTLLIAFSIPLFLHLIIYRSSSSTHLPSFLLVGPSGSGKTTLLTLFERGTPASTHISQTPLTAEISLPVNTTAASSRYRSVNDPTLQVHKPFLLIDTPGHGKLRHHALSTITQPQNLKGIIFVVDSASIASEEGAQEAAEYLHNLLLLLQKRITGIKSSKAPTELPVLIAANKLDLFTALPATLVKATLEKEITDVRKSRAKGLLDSGIGMGESELPEERDWLGDGGEGKFSFAQMAEVNVDVAVIGGSLQGADSVDVQKWWDWIGNRL